MSSTSRPRRKKANTSPAAVVLAEKRTRRSSEQVTMDEAALQAKREEIVKKRDEELRDLALLEHQLKAKNEQAAAYEARPPSVMTPSTPRVPLASDSPSPQTPPPAHERRTTLDDIIDPVLLAQSPAAPAQSSQKGKIKRVTREDLETYRQSEPGLTSDMLPVTLKENLPPGSGAQKRKAEGNVNGSSTKKGRPGKPAGVTAAAKAKFSGPPATTPTSTTPIASIGQLSESEPQGVYTQAIGGLELDADDTVNVGRPLNASTTRKDAPGAKILQLSVVDVASIPIGEEGQPAPAISSAVTTSNPTPLSVNGQFTMRHLEAVLGPYSGLFNTTFVPQMVEAIGNETTGPWQLYGFDLIGTMRTIAAKVWPADLHIDIIPRQPFYEVTKQKLSEYRNQVGKEALEVVSTYMQSSRFDNAEERAAYVEWAFRDEPDSDDISYPFRYETVEECEGSGILKGYGAYQGTLIRRTFACHVRRIGKPVSQYQDHPCNALALVTTAVERALKMWKSGNLRRPAPRTEEAKFSDRLWGRTAIEYLKSITSLSDVQWEKILQKAEVCARGLDEDSGDDHSDGDDNTTTFATGRAHMVDGDCEDV